MRQKGRDNPAAERILAAADKRFLSEGFSRVTMDELASQLGMSKKTLYRAFPGKAQLLEAMLARRFALIAAELEEIIRQGEAQDFSSQTEIFLRYLSYRLGEVKRPFMRDVMRFAPELFRKIEAFRAEMVPRYLRRILSTGQQRGMIRSDVNIEIAIELLLTLIQQVITPEATLRLDISVDAAFKTIIDVMFEGLLTKSGQASYKKSKSRARRK